MSSNDSEFESTSTRARKRMLPSVAEIARELSRKTAADAASILTTSRKVCAEELVRIKEGHESVPVDVLVERARLSLEHDAETAAGTFTFELPPPSPAAPSMPAAPLPEGADPFGETSGKLDLRWEGDAMESPHGHGDEVPPEPRPSPFEMSFPPPDLPPGSQLQAGQRPPPPQLTGLDLEERFASQPSPAHRSKVPFFLVVAIVAAAAGAVAWYFVSGPSKPAGPPPSVAMKRKARTAPAEAAAPAAAQAAPTASATPVFPATPVWIKSGGVPPAPTGVPAHPPPATKVSAMSVAPEPVRVEPKAKLAPAAPMVKAASAANSADATNVAANAPKPSAENAATQAPSRKGEKASSSAMQVQVRAGTLVTPDWTGAPVHVVHFSSFQEKPRAEKHAAALAKELGIPVRAVQVDLGEKGLWYRTVAGEFASGEEALAFRSQLLEKGTPGVGLVYRMMSKK
jgi:SPOR domain